MRVYENVTRIYVFTLEGVHIIVSIIVHIYY